MTLANDAECWGLSPSKYVQEAVKNAEEYWKKNYNNSFHKNVSTPFPADYRPELDVTPELDKDEASYYHSAIGILRWFVELGRVDIVTVVSL